MEPGTVAARICMDSGYSLPEQLLRVEVNLFGALDPACLVVF